MKKGTMLKMIAQKAYDVSYAANLNFATYDIVSKFPGIISFLSIVIGILGLVFPQFRVIGVSLTILILGILSLYTNAYAPTVKEYEKLGKDNTALLYRLKRLYFKVKDSDDDDQLFVDEEKEYKEIELLFNQKAKSKQILFASWFAHYKLFVEKDYSWMDEQLHFGWWKDKIPGTAKVAFIILLVTLSMSLIINWCEIIMSIKEWFNC